MDDSTLNERVAEEIRVLIARRRITASELARKAGMTQRSISRRITGEKAIDMDDLEKIAAALEVEIGDLLPKPAHRDDGGQSSRPRNTYGNPDLTVRTMRSAQLVTADAAHQPYPEPTEPGKPDRSARRPVVSYRHSGVTG